MDILEQAQTKLEEARSAHAVVAADFEARLAALPEDASADDVQAVTDELTTQLDSAEDLVKRTQAQLDATTRVTEARRASAALIPAGEVEGRVEVKSEPAVYDKRTPHGPSFFNDLYSWNKNHSSEALGRLERNTKMTAEGMEDAGIPLLDREGRALSSTTTAGGDFLPPLYFGELYAEVKRARRVTANLVQNLPLAAVGNSITIPRMTTGASTAVQTADNQNLSNTDAVTATLTVPVCTVAGYADLSRQIVERSEPGLDVLIIRDLLKSYNTQVNTYVVNGLGSSGQPLGILKTSGINAITYTDASPTVPELYPKLADAVRQINENIFEPASAYVMTARRWAWMASQLDSNNRPLVVINTAGPFNALGLQSQGNPQYLENMVPVGWVYGIPVYVDETIPKTDGTSTNQDTIFTAAFDEHILWEDSAGPRQFSFEGILSQTAGIRLEVFGYMAFTAGRYPKASSAITGTGLTAPTF
jgi:HK97 family phage major capsid protein